MTRCQSIWNGCHVTGWAFFLTVILFVPSTIGPPTQQTTQPAQPAKPPRLADKPVLGWNSYYPLECEKKLREGRLQDQVNLLIGKGLNGSGYKTIIIECGWEDGREADGSARARKKAFPSKSLSGFGNFLKSKDLRLGLATHGAGESGGICPRNHRQRRSLDLNSQTNLQRRQSDDGNDNEGEGDGQSEEGDGQPQGDQSSPPDPSANEEKYISSLVGWGMSYLFYRPCDWIGLRFADSGTELDTRYGRVAEAVVKSKADMVYATGGWGVGPEPTKIVANSWRVSDDSNDHWGAIIRIVNGVVPFADKTAPGGFNDLGFLQVGANDMTVPERVTQFIFWAAAKSHLIFSTDISRLDQFNVDMLKNPAALAVNQDSLGKSITFKRRYTGQRDIWSGPLSDGSTVAVVINWAEDTAETPLDLVDIGFSEAHIFEAWTGKDLGVVKGTYTTSLARHACMFLTLKETKPAPKRKFKSYPAIAAELMGTAKLRDVTDKIKAVTMISPRGTAGARWINVDAGDQKGNVLVSIDYINAEIEVDNNKRTAQIIINDTEKVMVDFPISGHTWKDIHTGFLVSLPGMEPGEANKIVIEGTNGWAPDIVSLGVEQVASTAPSQ